jgi:hypothetical protein
MQLLSVLLYHPGTLVDHQLPRSQRFSLFVGSAFVSWQLLPESARPVSAIFSSRLHVPRSAPGEDILRQLQLASDKRYNSAERCICTRAAHFSSHDRCVLDVPLEE